MCKRNESNYLVAFRWNGSWSYDSVDIILLCSNTTKYKTNRVIDVVVHFLFSWKLLFCSWTELNLNFPSVFIQHYYSRKSSGRMHIIFVCMSDGIRWLNKESTERATTIFLQKIVKLWDHSNQDIFSYLLNYCMPKTQNERNTLHASNKLDEFHLIIIIFFKNRVFRWQQ